jgi:hypothetical protein
MAGKIALRRPESFAGSLICPSDDLDFFFMRNAVEAADDACSLRFSIIYPQDPKRRRL